MDDSDGTPLAEITAFGIDNYPTPAECEAAKMRGEIPPQATCQNQLLLCPSATFHEYIGDVVSSGTYAVFDGTRFRFDYASGDFRVNGTLGADGSLHTVPEGQVVESVWRPIDPSLVTVARCEQAISR